MPGLFCFSTYCGAISRIRANGYKVTYVQNVTDIDDRSIAAAQAEGTTVEAIIGKFYGHFKAGMRTLGVREPDFEPAATQHIGAIVDMIAELIAKKHAYATDDGVYFAVKSFPRYGELAHRDVDELLIGARIAENEHKHDPLDFALWKFAKPGEPAWPSPWGEGRPAGTSSAARCRANCSAFRSIFMAAEPI